MTATERVALMREIKAEVKRRKREALVDGIKTVIKGFVLLILFAIVFIMAWFWSECDANAEGLNRIRNGVAPIIAEEPEDAYDFSEDDEWVLLHIMQAEAGNQGVEGQALVGRVVISRWEQSERFHCSTLREVVEAPNQFSTVRSGAWYADPNADSYEALELLRSGWDESQGAVFFRTTTGHFTWANYLFTYGGHHFYN